MWSQASTESQQEHGEIIRYMNIIRNYVDPHCCLCSGMEMYSEAHDDACAEDRQELEGSAGRYLVTQVMSSLFQIFPWVLKNVQVVGVEEDMEDGNFGVDDVWIATRYTNYRSYEE